MRIADSTAYTSFLSNIQKQQEQMLVAQEQVSSGKKVEKPSDDPEAAADIIRITGQQALDDQFTKNLNTASGRLTAADNALNSVQQMIDQIRTLGLQGLD